MHIFRGANLESIRPGKSWCILHSYSSPFYSDDNSDRFQIIFSGNSSGNSCWHEDYTVAFPCKKILCYSSLKTQWSLNYVDLIQIRPNVHQHLLVQLVFTLIDAAFGWLKFLLNIYSNLMQFHSIFTRRLIIDNYGTRLRRKFTFKRRRLDPYA